MMPIDSRKPWRVAVAAICLAVLGAFSTPSLAQTAEGETVSISLRVFETEGCDGVLGQGADGPCVREALIYVPSSYSTDAPAPLHMAFHGGGGNARSHMEANAGLEGRLNRRAEEGGFIVVYPEGLPRQDGRGRNWNDCRGDVSRNSSTYSSADDVRFVRLLVDELSARYRIDRDRVYASGMSNGGMIVYRLAAEAADLFAGFSATAALMPVTSECPAPTIQRPMMITQGMEDRVMPTGGGCVAGECDRGQVMSLSESALFWVNFLRSGAPEQVELPNRVPDDDSSITRLTFAGTVPLVVNRIDGGGHTIPGDQRLSASFGALVGAKNRDTHGADLDADFFADLPPSGAAPDQ